MGMTGVVAEISDDDGIAMALVDTGPAGVIQACLITCPDARVGDTVMVHSGYVLQILDFTEDVS
jgi:hydrogenase maturation factor